MPDASMPFPPLLRTLRKPSPVLRPNPTLPSNVVHAKDLAGTRVYDPGFANTLACTSSITLIDGAKGVLRHRGYPIEQLARQCEFLEVAYLLLYSQLPTRKQLAEWKHTLFAVEVPQVVQNVVTTFPPSAHPMAILQAALAALGSAKPELNPVLHGPRVYDNQGREEAITVVLGVMPKLVAGIWRHCQGMFPAFLNVNVNKGLTYAGYMLRMADIQLEEMLVKALDLLLLLHADHEQNCSTSTVRNLSSSGVDLFSCLAGGVAALYGPLHGGATEAVLRMLEELGSETRIDTFLQDVKSRKRKLMGFGHRVYRNYDPRAKIIRQCVDQVLQRDEPLLKLAAALEKKALADGFFVSRRLFPNCDFYSGVLYRAMGFDASFFPVLFALARCSGWVAHWKEFLDDPDRRIARPHQRYIGEIGPLQVPDIDERQCATTLRAKM